MKKYDAVFFFKENKNVKNPKSICIYITSFLGHLRVILLT